MAGGEIVGFIAAVLAFSLSLSGFFLRPRKAAHWAFAVGMGLMGLEALFATRAVGVIAPESVLFWMRWKLVAMAAMLSPWLIFALAYSRGNADEFLRHWRVICAGTFVLPVFLAVTQFHSLAARVELSHDWQTWFVPLQFPGLAVEVMLVAVSVVILVNLERTFRATVGTLRWRIKYLLFGVTVLFAARIYTGSQALLFSGIAPSLMFVQALALILGCVCVAFSMIRSKAADVDVYPSHAVLRHSVTATLVGAYFLVIGFFAKIVTALGGHVGFQLKALLLLVAFMGLAGFFFSDRLRQRIHVFVSQHFQRPSYDYRVVWSLFTAQMASTMEPPELCRRVARLVAETFNLLTVSVWLVDEFEGKLTCTASTALTESQVEQLGGLSLNLVLAARHFQETPEPLDLDVATSEWATRLSELSPNFFGKGGNRILVPLVSGGELLGLLAVADRVGGLRFTREDFFLLKCIADQVAASLRNLRMSQQLVQARELEAFQAMSAFVVHDLKNTTAALSLMVRNMSAHFEKPEFRKDAIRDLSKSVDRMTDLISRMNMLRQKLEIRAVATNLNEFIERHLSQADAGMEVPIVKRLELIPHILLDPEQFEKVLTNLLLNAQEAMTAPGEIRIGTSVVGDWVCMSVADTGCGMTREFVRTSLFRPFQSTKKKGLGIGMFHSRMIVEAHRGRIEVQSAPGEGTTFKTYLPLKAFTP